MDSSFENGAVLLLIAAVVATITRRLPMPNSVGLVTAGVVLSGTAASVDFDHLRWEVDPRPHYS